MAQILIRGYIFFWKKKLAIQYIISETLQTIPENDSDHIKELSNQDLHDCWDHLDHQDSKRVSNQTNWTSTPKKQLLKTSSGAIETNQPPVLKNIAELFADSDMNLSPETDDILKWNLSPIKKKF